ncbi:response regulator [Chloroflexota bacterium]
MIKTTHGNPRRVRESGNSNRQPREKPIVKEKILIVEDNAQNMRLLEMTLLTLGYHILRATDGETALLKAIREQPDLIIMNIQIPKMDGIEVTRRLRQIPECGRVPIIAVTGRTMKGDREQILQAGCNVYLPKPINTREFPHLVTRILQPYPPNDSSV